MQNHVPQFSVYNQFMDHSNDIDIFSEKRRMLALWCANIERTIVSQRIAASHVFACFQQLDYFLPVIDRYRDMTQYVEHIWVFGTPSQKAKLPNIKGIHYIELDQSDILTQEWFLLVNHPIYSRSLSAIETTPPNTPHSKRSFKGILSSNPAMIEPVYNATLGTFSHT
jgi:DICT domain-containing protein